MDVFGPLLHLALKSLVVLFPLTVGGVAFRRLAMSTSSNAWIYAVMFLYAAAASAGALPWALGITQLNWLSVLLALSCPIFWIGVLMICDLSRGHSYGADPVIEVANRLIKRARPKPKPLVLENPDLSQPPVPVFRHRKEQREKPHFAPSASKHTRHVLALARDLRTNRTSEGRRPKLLPPPQTSDDLPFVTPGHPH